MEAKVIYRKEKEEREKQTDRDRDPRHLFLTTGRKSATSEGPTEEGRPRWLFLVCSLRSKQLAVQAADVSLQTK